MVHLVLRACKIFGAPEQTHALHDAFVKPLVQVVVQYVLVVHEIKIKGLRQEMLGVLHRHPIQQFFELHDSASVFVIMSCMLYVSFKYLTTSHCAVRVPSLRHLFDDSRRRAVLQFSAPACSSRRKIRSHMAAWSWKPSVLLEDLSNNHKTINWKLPSKSRLLVIWWSWMTLATIPTSLAFGLSTDQDH